MKVLFFAGFLFSFFIQVATAQVNFENALQRLIEDPNYKNAQIGIHVMDVNSGKTYYSLNADKLFIPASTMKVITTATTLEILGANYRFKTEVAYSGKIKDNSLTGDLVIVGGGDPALGSEYFKDYYLNPHFLDVWASRVKSAGISVVEENLVLDCSVYDTEKIPDTWIWEDIGNYYGAGANALTVYDNLFRITFQSPKKAGEKTSVVSMYPEIAGIEIENEVLSSDVNKDLAYVYGSPFDKSRVIRGTIPKNRNSFTIKAAVQKPEELLAEEFLKHLAENGVFVKGKILFEKVDSRKKQTLYIQESPTLGEIMKVLNHESINLFAEHFLKQLSVVKTGTGNRQESIEIVKDFWKGKLNGFGGFFMEDGSGLSHFNAVSPQIFTSVLEYMYHSSDSFTTFYQSLPSAGDGTLSGFDASVFSENELRAKSGSMTRVRCYTGYLNSDSGKELAFSFMFNQFSGTHSKLISEIENLLAQLKKIE